MSSRVGVGPFGVGSWIERRARFAPHDIALIVGDRPVSYAELAERVRRVANGLRSLGVARGDRVAWVGPNHPAFLETFFATALVGAALAPVNHRLSADEIARILAETEPTVLVRHGADRLTSVPPSVRERVAVGGETGDSASFEELAAAAPADAIQERVSADDLCFMPHTSGTTGRPKAIMLTHGNITWNAINMIATAGFRCDDVTVAIAPFFRTGGVGVNVLPLLFAGGSVVVPTAAGADEILRLTARHGVTLGFANPDLLDALLRSDIWPEADLSSIRFIITGGAPIPERLIRAYLDRGLLLLQGYGLSEAGPACLLLHPEDALRKLGSAGKPLLQVDVRIEGASGSGAEPGETAELLIRGPNVMAGYWKLPEATREALTPDGWLRTGDAARMDEDGFVWIVDRIAEGFTTDGHVVYPADVERVVLAHPGVEDAGVVGIPNDQRGAVAAAFVVLEEGTMVGERELLAFCRRELAAPQVPVSVTFVDRLPRSSVGKLIRSELARIAAQPQD